MKKGLFASVLSVVLSAGLTACSGAATTATSAPAAATEAATEAATTAAESKDSSEKAAASTSDWKPATTVSVVVPASAGGNTDLSARVFAEWGKKITGCDFIVVNAAGAAGSVAANQVLGSAPDGCTFLYGHNLVNVANIAGVTDYNYSAFKLGPTFAKDPAQQLYVNKERYADLTAFIEAAKAAPGQLKACAEVGAYTYYLILEFEKAAGIDIDIVDAGSNADKLAAMLSGQVDLMPGAYINCKDYLESGDFVCLGAPTEKRYDLIKDIPTLKEQGVDVIYPDCDFSFYFPKETPDEIITWYNNLVKDMTSNPEAQAAIANVDMMPYYLDNVESEKNDEIIYKQIKTIADELEK